MPDFPTTARRDPVDDARFDEAQHLRRLKRTILAPSLSVLLLAIAIALGSASVVLDHQSQEETRRLAERTLTAFDQLMELEAKFMASNLDQLLSRPDVVAAWRAGDMGRLAALLEPIHAQLSGLHNVSIFHFIDADGIERLRVHKPYLTSNARYETTTLAEARRTKKDAWGLELGRFGHFAPRYVRNWMIDGALAGHVLLGVAAIPPERIAERLGLQHDAGYLVVIRPEHLTDIPFEQRREDVREQGGDFEDFVIACGTLSALPPSLKSQLARDTSGAQARVFRLKADHLDWSCYASTIDGPGGKPLADLVVLRDTSDEAARRNRIFVTLVLSILLPAVILLLLLRWSALRSVAELSAAMRQREREYQEKVRINEELLRSREALTAANAQLVQANQAKAEFLASISHEIRTPLNAVIGFSEILINEVKHSRVEEYARSMQAAGQGLLRLINDILDLSRIEAGRMEVHPAPTNLREALREVQQIFAHACEEKRLTLSLTIDPDVPPLLMLDGVRLRQVLFNLVGNAVKFTHKGGVFLHVWRLATSLEAEETEINVCVRDTGIGIPADQRERIFEAFRQQSEQSPAYGGTGLGLTICRRLVTLMGGRIELTSSPGVGSEFRVVLERVRIVREDGPTEEPPVAEDQELLLGNAAAGAAGSGGHEGGVVSTSGAGDASAVGDTNAARAESAAERAPKPSPEQSERWRELARLLRADCAEEVAQLARRLNISRAAEMAARIVDLAHTHEAPTVVAWATELQRHAERFDVERLRALLSGFEAILEELESPPAQGDAASSDRSNQ